MSRLSIIGRLYKWWRRWDATNLVGRQAAPVDHTVILTRWSILSQLTTLIPLVFGCTYWSHSDPYVWGLTTSKIIESIDFILAFQDFLRQRRPRFL